MQIQVDKVQSQIVVWGAQTTSLFEIQKEKIETENVLGKRDAGEITQEEESEITEGEIQEQVRTAEQVRPAHRRRIR